MERTFRGRWPVTSCDQLRAYLAVRDVPCPKCGHCLRGIRDPRCPECGKELDVWAIHEPRRGRFAVVPDAPPGLAVLINVVLAILILGSAAGQRGVLPALAWLAPAVIGAFACSLAYWPILLKYQGSTVEDPSPVAPLAWMLVVAQTVGLVLLWV